MGVVGGAVGFVLNTPAGFALLGILGGIGLWFSGTRHVNSQAPGIIRAFQSDSEKLGRRYLDVPTDGSAAVYQFESHRGGGWLIDPASQYKVVTMLVKDASVSVHSATVLDLPDRDATVNDSTDELFYDQVTGVEYEQGVVAVRTSDGTQHQYPSSQKPDSALSDVQRRVREYKQA